MTEPDPLETELSSLRPYGPSTELKRRIGEQLAPRRSRRLWTVVAAVGSVAACIVAVILLRPPANDIVKQAPVHLEPANDSPPIVIESSDIADAFDGSLPTFWTYSRALADPSHKLDELLDKHSVTIQPADQRGWQVVFLMSDLKPIAGEF